ncbi:MAG: MerR family transcriptional regulator [Marinomonas sp.]
MKDTVNIDDLFPIRELSARTQVNTVTIRAWERRYGLLTPQRTDKGHRLYSEQDVIRVEKILALIARGVSVGKVKAMLKQEPDLSDKQDMTLWQHAITQINMVSQTFHPHQLEHLIADYFVNYPVSVCRQNLFEPVLLTLQKDSAKNQAQASFIESELLAYTLRRLKNSHGDKLKGKGEQKSLMLTYGDNTAIWPLLFLCLELDDAHYDVQLINQNISLESFVEISQNTDKDVSVFYQDGLWRDDQTALAQKALVEDENLVICGTAAIISQVTGDHQVFSALSEFDQYLLKK